MALRGTRAAVSVACRTWRFRDARLGCGTWCCPPQMSSIPRLHALAQSRGLRVLGIETSCDDTAVAVIDEAETGEATVLADVVSSQWDVHAPHRGIVPSLAARSHADNLPAVLTTALERSGCAEEDIDVVCVTGGPGLLLCLKVGFVAGAMLAHHLRKPFVVVNHLEAHALVSRLLDPGLQFPFMTLLVSGGHTMVVLAKGVNDFEVLGTTLDDSVGEAFDKVARMLRLGYHENADAHGYTEEAREAAAAIEWEPMRGHPGAVLEALAREGNDKAVRLPTPLERRGASTMFSYSGLKTAVLGQAQQVDVLDRAAAADFCASFQRVATQHLETRVKQAFVECGGAAAVPTLVVCGGVAANNFVRERFETLGRTLGIRVVFPAPRHCTDNGTMVAWTGLERHRLGLHDAPLTSDFTARWPLGTARRETRTPGAAALAVWNEPVCTLEVGEEATTGGARDSATDTGVPSGIASSWQLQHALWRSVAHVPGQEPYVFR